MINKMPLCSLMNYYILKRTNIMINNNQSIIGEHKKKI